MVFGLKLALPSKKTVEAPQEAADVSKRPSKGASANAVKQAALTVNEFVARNKRNKEKGLEPTKPELIAYARYLGIDAITDADLMWIAEDALNAPLPCEWTEHTDSGDRVFYFHTQKHASSWTHPLEQVHRDTYKRIVEFRNADLSRDEQKAELEKLRQQCDKAEKDTHKELQTWTEHIDDQGKHFFFNRERQQSVWTDPRPAHCHSLYLQMKALRMMSKHCGVSVSTTPPETLTRNIINRPLVGDLERERQRHEGGGGGGGAGGGASHRGGASSPDEDRDADREQKRKKKKRKDKHAKDLDDELEDIVPHSPRRDFESFEAPRQQPQLQHLPQHQQQPQQQQQRPPLAKIDDGWSAQKSSPRTLPPMGRNPLASSRLSTPPGDGLPSIGRARIRAGIKLEPIHPTA